MTRHIMVLVLAGTLAGAGTAGAANRACGLLTAAELESAVGGKVSGLSQGGAGVAGVEMCSASTPAASILLRIAKSSGRPSGEAERAGLEIARKMGAEVEVRTFGPVTCSTIVPPQSMADYGFNTTCSVVKAGQVAAIEVNAKSRKDQVPIEKLRPLAEKIAGRI